MVHPLVQALLQARLQILGVVAVEKLAVRARQQALSPQVVTRVKFFPRAGYASCSITARVTSAVECEPPRSGVKVPAATTCSIAAIRRCAAAVSPRCSSIIAPDQCWPSGLAMPSPTMSGAEPCTGSNIEG